MGGFCLIAKVAFSECIVKEVNLLFLSEVALPDGDECRAFGKQALLTRALLRPGLAIKFNQCATFPPFRTFIFAAHTIR